MKYALFDAQGFPEAFYAPEINGPQFIDGRPNPAIPEGTIQVSDADWADMVTHPGLRRWDGTKVVAYEPPPAAQPVPHTISRRQFFQQLANLKVITEDEAFAAMTGAVPQIFLDAFAGLPADQQFAAKMLVAGATTFDRTSPLLALSTGHGFDDAALDALWRDASQL